jgi:hypothetical protein
MLRTHAGGRRPTPSGALEDIPKSRASPAGLLSLYLIIGALTTGTARAEAIISVPPTDVATGEPFAYRVATDFAPADELVFSLENAPVGMTILPRGGLLTWTPAPGQNSPDATGITVRVRSQDGREAIQVFSLDVSETGKTYRGYFVAPDGDKRNDGSPQSPFSRLKEACALALPGDTIYVRGGTYTNPG